MSASLRPPHPSSAEYVLPTRLGMLIPPPPSETVVRIMAAMDAPDPVQQRKRGTDMTKYFCDAVGRIVCTSDDIHNFAATEGMADCYFCATVHPIGEHDAATIDRVARAIYMKSEESITPLLRCDYEFLSDWGREHYRAQAVAAINAARPI
jgi:hypothetical protein